MALSAAAPNIQERHMTWIGVNIHSYDKTKNKAKMANERRRMAQKLLQMQMKRSEHKPAPPVVKPNRHGKHK
jgi:hypothetical protein